MCVSVGVRVYGVRGSVKICVCVCVYVLAFVCVFMYCVFVFVCLGGCVSA